LFFVPWVLLCVVWVGDPAITHSEKFYRVCLSNFV